MKEREMRPHIMEAQGDTKKGTRRNAEQQEKRQISAEITRRRRTRKERDKGREDAWRRRV